MRTKIHAFAGAIALLMVSIFWGSTAWSELFGDENAVIWVKTAVLNGMLVLVPAMMVAGASGAFLGRGRQGSLISKKKERMAVIGGNGLLVLLPSAVFLAMRAQSGQLDALFYGIQAVELVAGAVNITLLTLNMRDGFAMTRKRRQAAASRRFSEARN